MSHSGQRAAAGIQISVCLAPKPLLPLPPRLSLPISKSLVLGLFCRALASLLDILRFSTSRANRTKCQPVVLSEAAR